MIVITQRSDQKSSQWNWSLVLRFGICENSSIIASNLSKRDLPPTHWLPFFAQVPTVAAHPLAELNWAWRQPWRMQLLRHHNHHRKELVGDRSLFSDGFQRAEYPCTWSMFMRIPSNLWRVLTCEAELSATTISLLLLRTRITFRKTHAQCTKWCKQRYYPR